jgi:hypothetical protein
MTRSAGGVSVGRPRKFGLAEDMSIGRSVVTSSSQGTAKALDQQSGRLLLDGLEKAKTVHPRFLDRGVAAGPNVPRLEIQTT